MTCLSGGVHAEIMRTIEEHLVNTLQVNISGDTKAGHVGQGPLMGDPVDPDIARISITVHENDPDAFEKYTPHGQESSWHDIEDPFDAELGATTWIRRFTVMGRALLDLSREDLENARRIASTVRSRVEHELRRVNFSAINCEGEYVSMPIYNTQSEAIQMGGPADSWDFYFKVRVALKTTKLTGA